MIKKWLNYVKALKGLRFQPVDSGPLEKTYLESVPTTEFGATTDIHQAPGHAQVIGPVLLGAQRNCFVKANRKTMPLFFAWPCQPDPSDQKIQALSEL